MADKTKEELYAEAQALGIEGRSEMHKDQLEDAIAKAHAANAKAEAPVTEPEPEPDVEPETAPQAGSNAVGDKGWTRGNDRAAADAALRTANTGSTGPAGY